MLSQNSQNLTGGNIVLRGNQLVWLPNNSGVGGQTPSTPTSSSNVLTPKSGSSPVKIHVIGSSSSKSSLSQSPSNTGGQTRTHTLPLTIKVNSAKTQNVGGTGGQQMYSSGANNDHNMLVVHRQPSPTGSGPSTVVFKGHGMPVDRASTGQHSSPNMKANANRQPYKFLFPAGQRENISTMAKGQQSMQGNFKQPTPTSGAVMKPIKSEFGEGKKSQLVYYTADGSTEEDVHGMTVGSNSLQTLSLTGLPSATLKSKPGLFMKGGLRKPCNCTKSMCLKLYCDCFANGEFCKNCNCTCCKNNLQNEADRSKAVKSCLERNPTAFQPKIGLNVANSSAPQSRSNYRSVCFPGKGRADTDRLHNKGCNCKKSSCLKNYCECYEAKVACTPRCKCVTCRNTEGDRTHRVRSSGLMNLATAAASAAPIGAQISEYPLRPLSPSMDLEEKPDPKKMPWYYMNDDVIQATTLCLVAQAEQMESKGVKNDVDLQRAVLREFGRCLQQIIQSATY